MECLSPEAVFMYLFFLISTALTKINPEVARAHFAHKGVTRCTSGHFIGTTSSPHNLLPIKGAFFEDPSCDFPPPGSRADRRDALTFAPVPARLWSARASFP
ncbi:hypothetical protein NDU88_001143 [Pleurodeles waltl]|uniref:Secreted protein n=1 Tax=Pleurodeles waltl TaxID=8319 RepID=A0AAV7KPL4_PLEWA|nr:hypothetical protein NDU88_001143 [Pleurodeles waltl]